MSLSGVSLFAFGTLLCFSFLFYPDLFFVRTARALDRLARTAGPARSLRKLLILFSHYISSPADSWTIYDSSVISPAYGYLSISLYLPRGF